jgi:putative ABC transport system permease protein
MKFFFWHRRRRERQLNDELQTHLQMAARDRVDRGDSPDHAARATRREFGNVGLVEQTTRDQWRWHWIDELLQDLSYGARMLRKNPGFTLVAILMLALGISVNTAVFSVVSGVLLSPLPYPHPEQLVALDESKPNFESGSISYPNFRDWQKNNRTFSAIAVSRGYGFNLTGVGEAEQLRARFITSDLFPMLGVTPLIGRTFATGEDEIGAAPSAMISEGLWRHKFSSSPDILGKTMSLDGMGYTVIGVVPAGFDLSWGSFRDIDVYVPLGQWSNPLLPKRGAGLGIHGIGRLKPGVTTEQARADMARVSSDLAAAYPDTNTGIGASIQALKQNMVGGVRLLLLVLLGAVVLVLLIACVNIANLMLARSTARTREFAIRSAVGAGQGRLVRQLLTESLLLALIGGSLGLLLAGWGTHAALDFLAQGLPRAGEVRLDARVLLFTVIISMGSGVFFGLVPAMKTGRLDIQNSLKESGRGASGARHRAQGVFVAVEMALALVLLISAGLTIRSLAALWKVNPGFDSHNVLTFGVSLPSAMRSASPARIRAALREVDQQLKTVSGVKSVSLSWGAVPLNSDDEDLFWIEGQPKPANDNEMSWSLSYVVEENYLQVMGIPLERGRFFTAKDNENSSHVVVIDDVFARKFFPDQDPIGKHIFLGNKGGRAEIVGVVGHVKQWGLDSDDKQSLRAELYFPYMQLPDAAMVLSWNGTGVMIRFDPRTRNLEQSIRSAIEGISNEHVVSRPQTMEQVVSQSLAAQRFSMTVLSIFAVLALALASVGIYGVVSYLVGQRRQEIGVRMALGAGRLDVLCMVLGDGARMTLAGIGIGIVAALILTRSMASMLFGVQPTDPLTFAVVAVFLSGVALLACYVPARRASRVDPIVALRYE